MSLEEFGYRIPRPGWSGRRRAIAWVLFKVVAQAAFALLLVAAFVSCTVAVGASMDALPR